MPLKLYVDNRRRRLDLLQQIDREMSCKGSRIAYLVCQELVLPYIFKEQQDNQCQS
jgi:hypothetical protein